MKANGWVNIKEKLPESGQEVLVYWWDNGFDIHQIHTATYFKKGGVMDTVIPNKYDMPEKNLLDALFNPENEIRAPENGFYIYDYINKERDGFRKHADVITHWQPLPKPPKESEVVKAEAGRMLPEGFACVLLSDGKTLAVFHPEGEVVVSEQRQFFVPSAFGQQ